MQDKYPSMGRSPVGEKSFHLILVEFSKLATGMISTHVIRQVSVSIEKQMLKIKQHERGLSDLLTKRAVSQVRFLWQEEGSSGPKTCGHLDKT